MSEIALDALDEPQGTSEVNAALLMRLRSALGDDVVIAEAARLLPYESDAMSLFRSHPAVVLLPQDARTAARAVKVLHREGIWWAPRGAGTGLSGGALAPAGGAVLALARLREILKVDPRARRARVAAGVVNLDLNRALAAQGLSFAPDPASQMTSTIGGNIAENAGGPHTLKYGTTSQHVLGLHVLLGDGTALELGGEEETMAGYDLVGLLTGSEGTLALVLEATLRLTPLPEAVHTFLAVYADVSGACRGVTALLRAGVIPAALEMIDGVVLEMLERAFHLGLPLDAGALLVGEVHGRIAAVEAQIHDVQRTLAASGAREVRLAWTAREREQLWLARRKAFAAIGRVSPNYLSYDTVVPRTRLPEVLARIAQIAAQSGLRIANIFHAGDGNLHPTILFDAGDPLQAERARWASGEILRACLSAEGVLSGEHGIGLAKRDAMRWVFTDAELGLMDQLRRIFDPWGQVNPGKVLPQMPAESAGDGVPSKAGPEPLARPRRDCSPAEEELAARIRAAAQNWSPIMPCGAATLAVAAHRQHELRTDALRRIHHYDPADMTVTVDAGVTLTEIEALLVRERQRLAWEAPDPQHATIGGVVAAGYWGSRAQATLHPKHSLLGLRAVAGDGQLLEFGGRVMKNVTGYDVPRLLVGSRGTLAVITRLTLRTYPTPERHAVAIFEGHWRDLLALGGELAAAADGWSQLDVLSDRESARLVVGIEGRTREEIEEARRVLDRTALERADRGDLTRAALAEGDRAAALHQMAASWLHWQESAVILRLVVSPGRVVELARRVHELCEAGGGAEWTYRIQAHPGIGLLRVAFDGRYQEAPLRRLLLALAEEVRRARGYRVLDRAPADQWWGWDPWGTATELRERMRRIRMAFDPRGVLSPWAFEG